jgi:hypothetical protein
VADCSAAGINTASPCRQQHAQSFPLAALARLGVVFTGQRFAGGTNGIQLIGLGSIAACRPGGPVDLDHLLMLRQQRAGQPGTEAPGPFNSPYSSTGRMFACEGQQTCISICVGWGGHVGVYPASRGHDCSSVRILVSVDPNNEVDSLDHRQHGQPLNELDNRQLASGPPAVAL